QNCANVNSAQTGSWRQPLAPHRHPLMLDLWAGCALLGGLPALSDNRPIGYPNRPVVDAEVSDSGFVSGYLRPQDVVEALVAVGYGRHTNGRRGLPNIGLLVAV